jgi:FkbM family methyltransferase
MRPIWRSKIQRLLRHLGYDLHRLEPNLADFLKSRSIDTVLDVGANIGQFASRLRAAGYRGLISSFEPSSQPFEALAKTAASDPKWQVYQFGLGDKTATVPIHISRKSTYNSLIRVTSTAAVHDPFSEQVSTETVPLRTLDSVLPEIRGDRLFLKIDTQGFDRYVLQGATRSLEKLLGVQMEVSVVHLYEGTWTLSEALQFMRDRGFIIAQVRPAAFFGPDPTSVLELDLIFRRCA